MGSSGRQLGRRWVALLAAAITVESSLARADEGPTGAPPASPPTTSPEPPPPPSEVADPAADEARARHRRGIQLFDEGDFRLALLELERAYALHPSYRVLYNIAQVHYQLGEYAKALTAFEQYLKEGGAEVAASRRAEVEADLATLRTRVGTLSVRVSVDGAELALNDQPLGRAPLDRALVDAGTLKVQASRPGYVTATRVVKLAGGDSAVVQIELEKATADVVVTTDRMSAVATGSWIATGALAAAAVGFGVAANGAKNRYEDKLASPIDGSPAEASADLERRRSLVTGLAITTDALIVTTVVGVGVSLYLTLRGKPTATAPARPLSRGAAWSVRF